MHALKKLVCHLGHTAHNTVHVTVKHLLVTFTCLVFVF